MSRNIMLLFLLSCTRNLEFCMILPNYDQMIQFIVTLLSRRLFKKLDIGFIVIKTVTM